MPYTPPRFTRTPAAAPAEYLGSASHVDLIPDALIRQDGTMITYESVWAGLGPNGEPAAYTIPGTYGGHATRAGRR